MVNNIKPKIKTEIMCKFKKNLIYDSAQVKSGSADVASGLWLGLALGLGIRDRVRISNKG